MLFRSGWVFMVEPELHLGPDVVVPDYAGWRRERLPVLPETPWISTPPDWIGEFISPSTETYDYGPKRMIYAREGVAHLWIADPRVQKLEAFQLTAGKWLLLAALFGDDVVCLPPFDAITFSLGLLWPYDPPIDRTIPPKA